MPTIWGETAKDVFLLGPFNLIGTVATLSMVKSLLTKVGPQAYGSTLGNLKIAGIILLGCIVFGAIVALGQRIFRIEQGEDTNKNFGLLLIGMLFTFVGSIVFFFRSLLILVGFIARNNPPPNYIDWMFKSIEIFQ